ncbi:MAG: hypothetical protein COA73_16130 [Candidatus Hydrogenedentota bacterium]|nr:MAG: hypothetical protein COA73_16130 [Candidatus Hydrogenedentota bacterium]
MNPMLDSKYTQLRQQLTDLKEVMQANREDVLQQHAEKENLLQEKWEQRKHLTTLKRISEDYDKVLSENNRYSNDRQELRDSLKMIISSTKALHNLKKS